MDTDIFQHLKQMHALLNDESSAYFYSLLFFYFVQFRWQ